MLKMALRRVGLPSAVRATKIEIVMGNTNCGKFRVFTWLVASSLLTACGADSDNLDSLLQGHTVTGSSFDWSGICTEHEISLGPSGAFFESPFELSFSLSAEPDGTFHSDPGCTTAITEATIAKNGFTAKVYYKRTSTLTVSLTTSELFTGTFTKSIFSETPTATSVLGQPNFTSNTANNGGITAQTLSSPSGGIVVGTKFITNELGNDRVLIWNSITSSTQEAADIALGQPDLVSGTANNGGVTSQSLNNPNGLGSDGTKLMVSDGGNNRVLIWNTIPTVTQQAANVVLGQPNLTSSTANNGGIGAATLSAPSTVYTDGTRLFVTDTGNHRVLIWSTIPTVDQTPADIVLGQANFTSSASGAGATGMNTPGSIVVSSDGKLLLSDTINCRILVWNTIPTASNTAADLAIGQPDLATNTCPPAAPNQGNISVPGGIDIDSQGRLFVTDFFQNRILIWNSVPTASGTNADTVVGQTDFVTSTANVGGIGASTVNGPNGLTVADRNLWIFDPNNHRILRLVTP